MGRALAKPAILLGVGGGVAAYKAVQLASYFFQNGFEVHVAMTRSAQRFVSSLTFSAVTNAKVFTELLPVDVGPGKKEDIYPHLYPATQVDICVILPATADLIAKIAHGFGDDIVSAASLSLSNECRRYFCPSMNLEMWNQKVVQQNVFSLERLGWCRIGPEEGHLACGAVGAGRVAEPDAVVRIVDDEFRNRNLCKDKQFLILSGPTLEHIDPVRFISNHSSGKMGKALAETAAALGANVDFVTGPVPSANLPAHRHINMTQVTDAREMLNVSKDLFSRAQIAIFAAAVADFTPSYTRDTKTPKPQRDFSLNLTSTPDIAATLCKSKHSGQFCIGFALETGGDAVKSAREKLDRKYLDAIVLNGLDSFNSNDGEFSLIWTGGDNNEIEKWGRMEKTVFANRLINKILT